MSQQIELSAVPNQSFEANLEGVRYAITLRACADFMAVDISRDGVDVVRGQRCCAGSLLIPYRHQYEGHGNFTIITNDDELPWYESFVVSQFLIYFTADEIANG